jgi:hypothetical protein
MQRGMNKCEKKWRRCVSGEAIVAKIDKLEEISGANTIQVAYVLGERVIVGKDSKIGDIGILFPAETQLSEEYCHRNNLYRHPEKNVDPAKKGFFDDNRKVRCQKFMKVNSDAYFAQIESLLFAGPALLNVKVGDRFTEINGKEICRKFISEKSRSSIASRQPKRKYVEAPLFSQHVDTEQFKYYVDKLPFGAVLSFHAKVHGTSARYSHTLVRRTPNTFKERLLNWCGLYESEKWEYLAGTRRVVLWPEHREKEGFNGPESFRFEWLDKLKPYLARGMTVYGEIVGYANGSPIMAKHDVTTLKDKRYEEKYGKEIVYKYGCPEGTNRFIIYRITYSTIDGNEIDFSVDQIKHWCEVRGFECTKEVAPRLQRRPDEWPNQFVETTTAYVGNLTDAGHVCDEDWYDESHVREGIVVRVDHVDTTPKFYKNKSFVFKCMEGIATLNTLDMEAAQGEDVS